MTRQPTSLPAFEEIEHTADWALKIRGKTLRQLLYNAARGMSTLLVDELDAIPVTVEEQINVEAYDAESLLVNWLGELAYRAEADSMVFAQFDLHDVAPTQLRAVVGGGRVPDLKKHIKAVTYHNLDIVETEDGLETTVVFDV